MRTRTVITLIVLALGAMPAFADSVFVNVGQVQGCFTGTSSTCTYSNTATYLQGTNAAELKFTGTNPSSVNITNSPFTYEVKLGTFSATNLISMDPEGLFLAKVTFTLPAGLTPPNWQFTGQVTGHIVKRDSTHVSIVFPHESQKFEYSYYEKGVLIHGVFYMNVGSINLDASGIGGGNDKASAAWVAYITSSPVPEPASLALLGSGLLTGAGVFRRKLFGR